MFCFTSLCVFVSVSQRSCISQAPLCTFWQITVTLCINHFSSPTAAVYYDHKNISCSYDDMFCVKPAVSIWVLIGSRTNRQYWGECWDVLSRSGGRGPDPDLSPGAGYYGDKWFFFSALWWSPWDKEMQGVEMESGWLVTTLPSMSDSNVTGGDGNHLCSPSFNSNDKGGYHSLLCSL